MVQIFIEAKRLETPEGEFLKAIIYKYVPGSLDYNINAVNGWTNLIEPTNVMIMQANSEEGGKNLVVFDADSKENGGGYEIRLKVLKDKLTENLCEADIFLWPDNQSDGTVEDLMLDIARKDLHRVFFDCFEDYETCLKGVKDTKGEAVYHCPDLKAKAFTVISSMPLSNTQRRHLGRGEWMFNNPNYWDLGNKRLESIVNFLRNKLG